MACLLFNHVCLQLLQKQIHLSTGLEQLELRFFRHGG
jgi:hypothetical protein